MLVLDPSLGASLLEKARPQVRLIMLEELNRHGASEPPIARPVHGSHAALAEEADIVVPLVKRFG
jgi:hypothetical protein